MTLENPQVEDVFLMAIGDFPGSWYFSDSGVWYMLACNSSPKLLWPRPNFYGYHFHTPSLQVLKSTVHLHGQFITSAIQFENLEFNLLFSTEDSLSTRVVGIYPKEPRMRLARKTNKIRTFSGSIPTYINLHLCLESWEGIPHPNIYIYIYTYLGSAQKRWFF